MQKLENNKLDELKEVIRELSDEERFYVVSLY